MGSCIKGERCCRLRQEKHPENVALLSLLFYINNRVLWQFLGTIMYAIWTFVKEHSDWKDKYNEEDIFKMLEFLVDNIFVVFAGKVFQQIIGIPMGTNCAALLADIYLYSYEAEFIQSLLSAGKKQLESQFIFTYRYIDDVLSINNRDFENYLGQMYPLELEIKRHDGEQHLCFLLGFALVNR